MNKRVFFIFAILLISSFAIISAYNSERDLNSDGKVSFSEWIKNIFGKISGNQIQVQQVGEQQITGVCLGFDGDGDGFPAETTRGCPPKDCNDADNLISPGAPEICGDSKNNDCDNSVDETACQEKVCTEIKDGGNNLLLADSGEECINPDVVNEYFCDSNNKTFQSAPRLCSQAVGINYFCYNGACKLCADTDAGINYTLAGSAYNLTFLNNPKQDYCINNTHLNESSCSANNAVISQPYNCKLLGAAYSCEQGACSCKSSYVKTSCANEVAVFKDASNCGSPDYSVPYDCNGDGVISTPSCISTTANVSIGNGMEFLPFDNAINYSNIDLQTVQVAEGYQGVEFDWNFSASEKLDFCQIEIETSSPADKFGYVLFNSTEEISEKTIYVDKLNKTSNAVCIKDVSGVTSVNDLSKNCTASNEVLLKCPSPANSTYNCQIIENGTTFQIWPLNHSAVKEMLSSGLVSGTACAENWNCTEFSDAVNQCGTRNCTELTNCGTILNKPLENKICDITAAGCASDWSCSDFGKCADGIKSRICEDLNNCGDETTKPSETSECKTKSLLFIILGIVGLVLIILLIWYFMKRGKSDEEYSESQTPHQPIHPRSPPAPPQNRAPQYAPRLAPQR